jgi:hypothetical protein
MQVGCAGFAYIFFSLKANRSEQRSVTHAFRLSNIRFRFFATIRLFSHQIFIASSKMEIKLTVIASYPSRDLGDIRALSVWYTSNKYLCEQNEQKQLKI